MSIYIRAVGNISIQDTLGKPSLEQAIVYAEPYVRCIEPDFKSYLNPMMMRRMSRIIKRAVVSSMVCLQEGGIEQPEAIISGTGLGCIEDTERFLSAIIDNDEKFLQPTYFIQSTHNTISSQIAIFLKCHSYNNTYTHRGISFETALMDAFVLFKTRRIHTALVGGHDEMTPLYFVQLQKLHFWKEQVHNSLTICTDSDSQTVGALAGEGSICFLMSDEENDRNYAEIKDMQLFYNIKGTEALLQQTEQFLNRNKLNSSDIDVFLCGNSGDCLTDPLYHEIYCKQFAHSNYASYKNLCGEFFTAPAFGLWSAASILKNGKVPDIQRLNNVQTAKIKHLLLFNHYKNKNYSLILLSSCGC
jgi:3-oxoacyl-(acyl-carrier-protein) synthase